MSGGLDSTALAATAKTLLEERGMAYQLSAFTTLFDGTIDRNEGYYAQLVADRLNIPIHKRYLLREMFDWTGDLKPIHTSEPFWNPMQLAGDRSFHLLASTSARVIMYGEGPDNALEYEWRSYLRFLVGKRKVGRITHDVLSHIFRHRRVPLLPTIPRMIKRWWSDPDWTRRYPTWLNPDFANRLNLRSRWQWRLGQPQKEPRHPVRPKAHDSFVGPNWDPLFQDWDAGELKVPLEVIHPYVDLRLLSYMLRVPAIPWCRRKHLIRCAMRSALPAPVLRRSKGGLLADPEWLAIRRGGFGVFLPSQLISQYVDINRVARAASADMIEFRTDFHLLALNYWLQSIYEPN
jgi:asparagine synthase (glutamine-hydrolysing)